MHILIVDDNKIARTTLRQMASQVKDLTVCGECASALEAFNFLRENPVDLLLLDIEMPRMDGFEVTNTLRHHTVYRDLPIIMITSRTGEKHRERAFSLGVTHYMGKPFQEADLLHHIEQILAEA